MGVTVNVAQFESVRKRMEDASRGNFLPALTARMAGTITKLLADEFRGSHDPYGNPWKPVFRRRRRDRLARARRAARGQPARADLPLVDSSRLRTASVGRSATQASRTSVRVIIPVDYASYHQEGTRRMPRRQILPDDKTGGLGPIWTAGLNRDADAVLKTLGKKE